MVIILAYHAGKQSSILSIRLEGTSPPGPKEPICSPLKEVLSLYPATETRVCIECVALSNMRTVIISELFHLVHVTIAPMEHFAKKYLRRCEAFTQVTEIH